MRAFAIHNAFVLILLGFLLQWPTLLTLVMFPILVAMYARLAITEGEMQRRFGPEFEAYAARTPRFLPLLRREVSAYGGDRPISECARDFYALATS